MTDRLPRNSQGYMKQQIHDLQRDNQELKDELSSLRQFVKSLDSLYNASDNFKDDSELFPFMRGTLTNALKLVNAPDGSLALLDHETNELVFVIVLGALSDQLTDHRIPADEGIAGWVVQNKQPALVEDTRRDPRFSAGVDETFSFQTQSIIAAPMIGDRKVYGVIEVLNSHGDMPFDDNDLVLLKLLCRAAGQALAYIDRMPREDEA